MKKLFAVTTLALAIMGGPLLTSAADKAPDKPAEGKAPAKAKFRPFNGKIKAVDKSAKTITLEGEKAQTFLIIAETKIVKDGAPVTLNEVVVGDLVGGRARDNEGKWEVLTLNLGKKAVRPAKKADDKKPETK